MATLERTDTPALFETAVEHAARLLVAGQVVALPTETVYGLAANALDSEAVRQLFAIKGRPPENPIIVHVAGVEMARQCVAHWTELAQKLAAAFWPGPLTLVLPKAQRVPDIVTAGGSTVGVRHPRHAVMAAVIGRCGFPLAAPSANLSGQLSPTRAEHVCQNLGDRIALVLDGGPCEIGIESTVLDVSVSPPSILRPGIVHPESLAAVTGRVTAGTNQPGDAFRSPGLLSKHYAPKAKLFVWRGGFSELERFRVNPEGVHLLVWNRLPAQAGFKNVSIMPREPHAFARALYAELHRADQAGARVILVEAVPVEPAWQGIADRLGRAAV